MPTPTPVINPPVGNKQSAQPQVALIAPNDLVPILRAQPDGSYANVVVPGSVIIPDNQAVANPQQAVITALAATSFDVEVAPAMLTDTSRYRLRAFAKTGGGGGSPAPSPAPTGFTVDNQRQASFMLAAGTVASDYEYELTEQA